jgi:iron complex outermembrane recepter protein
LQQRCRYLKLLTTLFFSVLLLQHALAQQAACTFSFRGNVVDANDQPLREASIFIPAIQRGVSTNESGSFVFENLCASTFTVEISFIGYEKLVQRVNVRKSASLRFVLTAEQKMLSEVIIQDHYDHISNTQSNTALSGAALEATRGKSLGEAMRDITGVNTIQSGPAVFKPVIHGVHSQRILILNNGIRHEGQQWGAEHAPEIDPFLASNIIVIKDAASIKYGTDALGGVVIVNPAGLPTTPRLGGTFNTVLQSNGRLGILSGMLEGASKKVSTLRWRVHGTVKKGGDFSAPTYMLTNTGVEELNFSTALAYHKNEKAGMEVFYSHFSTQLGILKGSSVSNLDDLETAYKDSIPAYTAPFSYGISSPRQEVKHDLIKLNAHLHKDIDTYSVQYGLQINQRKEFDIRRDSLNAIPAIDLTLFTHTLDAEWERAHDENNIRCLGINGMLQSNSNNYGTQRLPFIPNFSNYSGGLYALQKKTVNSWQVEAGLRFDYRYYTIAGRDFSNSVYKDDLTFANASATLGALRKLTATSSFNIGISSAWRPPHVAELYSLGTHQSAAAIEFGLLLDERTNQVREISQVDFKNEKAVKWVSTYRYAISKTQLEATGYINYIFNYIYLKPEGILQDVRGTYPYFRYKQTDASFLGLDLRVDRNLAPSLGATVKTSLLYAKDQTNNDFFIYIPSNRVELSLTYKHGLGSTLKNFFVETKGLYVMQQTHAPRVVSVTQIKEAKEQDINLFATDTRAFDFAEAPKGYFLAEINMGLSVYTQKQKIDFRISCQNLLNATYREYTNRMRYFADEVGRNISLSVKYNF